MAFAKFQENRSIIDGEIAENHSILVNLTGTEFVYIVDLRRSESQVSVPALLLQWHCTPCSTTWWQRQKRSGMSSSLLVGAPS